MIIQKSLSRQIEFLHWLYYMMIYLNKLTKIRLDIEIIIRIYNILNINININYTTKMKINFTNVINNNRYGNL